MAKQEEIDGEEVEKKEKHNELNLDLTSARYSNPSETLRESSLQRIKQIKVNICSIKCHKYSLNHSLLIICHNKLKLGNSKTGDCL